MWNGMPTGLPIQGLIVATVFCVIAFRKVMKGARGSEAIIWNTVGILTLLYLFTSAAWIASGSAFD